MTGTVSLPFSHSYLKEMIDSKEKKSRKIEKYIVSEKNNLLNVEKKATLKSDRLSLFRNILLQSPTYYQIAPQKRNISQNLNFSQTRRRYISNRFWK